LKTIKDMEVQVEERVSGALRELDILPEGYRCSVRLRGEKRDKKRPASFEKNWSADTDSIYIKFERIPEQPLADRQLSPQGSAAAAPSKAISPSDTPTSDLIRALDRAESRPGYDFVALKWFRDTALPAEGFSWVGFDSVRHILREAIDKRLILTSKVPNPKSPQFPVTAIRLNRLMPEVRAILGSDERPFDFQPVPIRGENLFLTLLRDRR